MKVFYHLMLFSTGLAAVCSGHPGSDRWAVREQETMQKTLTLSGPPMRIVVDNLEGYVHVRGTGGSEVRVIAHKTIRAETESDLAQAKSEVSLQMSETPGAVSLYYDAPWRCNGQGNGSCHGNQRRFYDVTFDIDVEIPRATRTVVSTVNGDVRIVQVNGDFDVGNVNGSINMDAISGSGDIHTVNGPVAVHFTRNPLAPSSFKTVNGPVDVYLQPTLSADLLFKTFNGEVYSDFEVSPRLTPVAEAEQHDGKFIYRSRNPKAGRVGQGGAELSFETLNGAIRLHKEQ